MHASLNGRKKRGPVDDLGANPKPHHRINPTPAPSAATGTPRAHAPALPDADHTWYTDESSFLQEGQRRAGAAVTTETEVIWAKALPAGTSAQRAELIALTQALKMAEGKKLNVYTDSRYAFATAHVHGEIYRRRGLLTSEGKEIKNKGEILALLKALFLPKRLSIIHCPGHQKGNSAEAKGNQMADQAAREAAMGTDTKASSLLIETSTPYTPDFFHYTETDIKNLQELGATYDREKKYWVLQGKPVMPDQFTFKLLDFLHQLTHLSYQKMRALLDRKKSPYYMLNKDKILHEVAESCQACVQVNASKAKVGPGVRVKGHRPGTHWKIDFTEVKPGLYGYKYLLVFVDTFSGWVEAFPTKHETAKVVTMMASLMGFSLESLLIDNDLIGAVQRTIRGIEVNDETISLDTMRQVCLGGAGHYLGAEQTLKLMQRDYLYPLIGDRSSPNQWAEQGRPDLVERAAGKLRAILASHFPSHIPADVDDAIRQQFPVRLPREAMRPAAVRGA